MLNIPPNASPKDVKQAVQNQLNQLKKIYAVLSDPEKRAAYDAQLASEPTTSASYYELLNLPQSASVATIKAAVQGQVQAIKQAFKQLSDETKRAADDVPLVISEKQPPDSDNPPFLLKTKPQTPVSAIQPLETQAVEQVSSQTTPAVHDGTPATRLMRLKAAVLDTSILFLPPFLIVSLLASVIFGLRGSLIGVQILMYGFGPVLRELQGSTGSGLSLFILTGIFMATFGTLLVINLLWLYRHGQTIGKRLVGIKIVNADGSRHDFLRILIMRLGLIWLVTLVLLFLFGAIALLIPLLDSLFILQSSQQCLHDILAKTRVVQAKNDLLVNIKARAGKDSSTHTQQHTATGNDKLASPMIRLGAAVLDILVFFIPVLLVLIMVFFLIGFLYGFASIPSLLAGRWSPGGQVFSAWMSGFMVFLLISFISIIVMNLVQLHRYGQSMGKRLLNIRVMRKNGKQCGLGTSIK